MMSDLGIFLQSGTLRTTAQQKTDQQLMDGFVEGREHQSFEALLYRHGPMIWGVCSRIVQNPQDAEDAFQATFLILLQKAKMVKPREMVGNWLYGVALRAAQKARSDRYRRQCKEAQSAAMRNMAYRTNDASGEIKQDIDRVLHGLPDKYRAPIILCDLQERTLEQTAKELGWPVGSVAGRLARGRQLLAQRLARLGYSVTGSVLATAWADAVSLPTQVLASTRQLAIQVIAGSAVPERLAFLINAILNTMLATKLKGIAVVAGLLLCTALGTGSVANALALQEHTRTHMKSVLATQPDKTFIQPAELKKPQETHFYLQQLAIIQLWLGQQQLLEGKIDKALECLSMANKLYPECGMIVNNYAWGLARSSSKLQDNLLKAEKIINEVITQAKTTDKFRPFYHGTRGTIYLKMGQYEEALRDLLLSSQRPNSDNDNSLHEQLVEVYEKLQDKTMADKHRNIIAEIKNRQGQFKREDR